MSTFLAVSKYFTVYDIVHISRYSKFGLITFQTVGDLYLCVWDNSRFIICFPGTSETKTLRPPLLVPASSFLTKDTTFVTPCYIYIYIFTFYLYFFMFLCFYFFCANQIPSEKVVCALFVPVMIHG